MDSTLPVDPDLPSGYHISMLRMAVLGSGSLGNSVLVEAGQTRVLVDAGLSAKQLVNRMAELGVTPQDLSGILLTHEHGDHARGLRVLLSKHNVPIYANALTREVLAEKVGPGVHWRVFEKGQAFGVCELTVSAFPIPHDAADPVGFVLQRGEASMAVVSDLGYITSPVREALKDLDGLFIESNYDQDMLDADTKRPWSTKQRISSRHGHLSNDQVGELMRDIATKRLRRVVLGHLSSDCNCPDLVTRYISSELSAAGCQNVAVSCAPQHETTGWLTIKEAQPVWKEMKCGALQGELF